jgi:glycosyltransferase involved in cell wall biosynthesis
MNRADRVIAISDELKRVLVSRGVGEDKIEVIVGAGVDIEKIMGLPFKDIKNLVGVKGKLVGYVGSIGRSRASERIIEAFEMVKKGYQKNIYLVMIGPCKECDLNYYLGLLKSKGLENSIFFTGYLPHDEVLSYMKSFDVAVSYHEGEYSYFNVAVPNKILEYLACGCVIVTTNQRMYKNILEDDINAILTEQNCKSFAEGILKVIDNSQLSNWLSCNALIEADKFSLKEVVDKYENIFQTMEDNR